MGRIGVDHCATKKQVTWGDDTTFIHSTETPEIMYYPWTGEPVLDTVASWDKVDFIASSSLLEASFIVVVVYKLQRPPEY